MSKDYIAIIPVGAGSSWYRCGDKTEAATKALAQAKRDWKGYADFGPKRQRKVSTYDVTGHEGVYWDSSGVYDDDTNEKIDTCEIIEIYG